MSISPTINQVLSPENTPSTLMLPVTLPPAGARHGQLWSIVGGAVSHPPQTIWDAIGRGARLMLRRSALFLLNNTDICAILLYGRYSRSQMAYYISTAKTHP